MTKDTFKIFTRLLKVLGHWILNHLAEQKELMPFSKVKLIIILEKSDHK